MDLENAKELKECLCCGGEHLKLVLDLGEQPLANSFIDDPAISEDTFPLKLNICTDCTHLQLSHAVNPDLLFKNYLYVSGTSQTLRDYFDWFAKLTQEYFEKAPQTVLDIACNDGSQLNSFKALGLTTFGVDPATNLHPLSNANHEVICDYFTEKYVYHYKNKKLDIITAQNVFAHNSYPLEFLTMCKEIMHDDSRLFIQTSQADMIKNNEFDTIYHEHLSFFNASSMKALADRAGLTLVDIRKTPIHGNSYMFVFSKVIGSRLSVQEQLNQEKTQGLQDLNTYLTYADRCYTIVEDLNSTIKFYKDQGYAIAGYGAAAKGNTLINFGGIQLDFIIDDNPMKQGLFAPGSHIPVVSIDKLDSMVDDKIAFIPLAWNFFTEIRSNIKKKRDKEGDVFVKYFPAITVN
jgi:C-methyltransferase C-terminal domain/Putative zinc binding domain/Methyltransferase domain